ncbi:MAG: nucleotide pyrophosphohydrolase [Eubacteriales bacterium]
MRELLESIQKFNKARDWEQFHSPKNLAIGLSIESAELLEIFQWMSEEDSFNLSAKQMSRVQEEIGDIIIYALNLSNKLGFNPVDAACQKLKQNEIKYPVDKAKGNSKKYTDL